MAAPTQGLGGIDPTTGQQITNGTTIGNYVMNGGQWYEWRDNKLYAPNGMWTGRIRYEDSSNPGEMASQITDQTAFQAWQQAYPSEGGLIPGGGWGGGTTSTYDAGGNLRGSDASNTYLAGATSTPIIHDTSSVTQPSPIEDPNMADVNYADLIRKTMGDAPTYTANPPSEGPNLSLVWPNYWEGNPNFEAQYAQWRDQRMAAGQGYESPSDLEAFRQHLIAIGAPDPGAPQAATTTTPPPTTTVPATTPPTAWTPPPAAAPASPPPATAPPPGMAPGASFNPVARTGTAQNLLGGFQMPNLPNELDLERLFPWIRDPGTAAANALAQAGFTSNAGNPFTSFLEGEVPRMANIARMQNIIGGGGGQESDVSADMPRILGGGITRATGQGMIPQLAAMARQYQGTGGGLNTTQQAFSEQYLTKPEDVLSLLSGLQNLAPDLRTAQRRVNENTLRRYGNTAGGTPNASIWDFLGL